jgi:hypothetical protein
VYSKTQTTVSDAILLQHSPINIDRGAYSGSQVADTYGERREPKQIFCSRGDKTRRNSETNNAGIKVQEDSIPLMLPVSAPMKIDLNLNKVASSAFKLSHRICDRSFSCDC